MSILHIKFIFLFYIRFLCIFKIFLVYVLGDILFKEWKHILFVLFGTCPPAMQWNFMDDWSLKSLGIVLSQLEDGLIQFGRFLMWAPKKCAHILSIRVGADEMQTADGEENGRADL